MILNYVILFERLIFILCIKFTDITFEIIEFFLYKCNFWYSWTYETLIYHRRESIRCVNWVKKYF